MKTAAMQRAMSVVLCLVLVGLLCLPCAAQEQSVLSPWAALCIFAYLRRPRLSMEWFKLEIFPSDSVMKAFSFASNDSSAVMGTAGAAARAPPLVKPGRWALPALRCAAPRPP